MTPIETATPATDDVLALLRRGLERVQRAWGYVPPEHQEHQFDYLASHDKVCITMALFHEPGQIENEATWADHVDPDELVLAGIAQEHLARVLPADWKPGHSDSYRLTEWNDAQRDPAPVIALYQRAIQHLERVS